MSSSYAARRRSGDPRTRAAAVSLTQRRDGRRSALALALVVAAALVSLAVLGGRGDDAPDTTTDGPPTSSSVDGDALMHAEVACDFLSKAADAAQESKLDERTRYAVAVLLLDQAIIESGRAAQSETGLVGLDTALQQVHAAGHEGDHAKWEHTLRTANTKCRGALG